MKIKQKWLTEIVYIEIIYVYNRFYGNFRVSATVEVRMHNIIIKEVGELNTKLCIRKKLIEKSSCI